MGNGYGASPYLSLSSICATAPAMDTDADIAGIPALLVSTDPWLLAHAEVHAARYSAYRFLAKPLDLDALLRHT